MNVAGLGKGWLGLGELSVKGGQPVELIMGHVVYMRVVGWWLKGHLTSSHSFHVFLISLYQPGQQQFFRPEYRSLVMKAHRGGRAYTCCMSALIWFPTCPWFPGQCTLQSPKRPPLPEETQTKTKTVPYWTYAVLGFENFSFLNVLNLLPVSLWLRVSTWSLCHLQQQMFEVVSYNIYFPPINNLSDKLDQYNEIK